MAKTTTKTTNKKGRGRKSAKDKRPFYKRTWFVLVCVAAVILISGAIIVSNLCLRTHKGEAVWVYIPGGASDRSVRDSLQTRLGMDEGNRVADLWAMMGSSPSVARGAYLVEPGQTVWSTARRISRGRQTPVKVRWNSVRTLDQMAEAVAKNLEFTPDDFIAALDSVLIPEGFNEATFPAAFLPDTYEFYWGTTPDAVIKKLYDYREKFWTPERRSKAKALGLTPEQVATVASIIEEETAMSDERPKVARLYLNRIAKKMPLQADPTVKFAIGDFSIKRITNDMLRTESPYNTYRNPGLPPGPIRIATKQSIDAVLNAPAHDYLYMCAKEDFSGYHNFAVDYGTHMANARRYQAELDRRNIH